VDVLSDLLERTRARGSLFAQSVLHAPWGFRFSAEPMIQFHVVLRGACHLRRAGAEPLALHQGDVPPATLNLVDQNGFRFYSETVRRAPTFKDIVGDFDLFHGPVPHSGMTHAEFLGMTRPKELYSSAGFTPSDVIRWGLLGYAERKGWELVRAGMKQLSEAKTEAERKQIRLQIERELAALRGEIIK